jgi:hypothetical protein
MFYEFSYTEFNQYLNCFKSGPNRSLKLDLEAQISFNRYYVDFYHFPELFNKKFKMVLKYD